MGKNPGLKEKLIALKSDLPAQVLEEHFRLRPDMKAAYTGHQKMNFKNDVAWIISFLAESVWASEPALFEEFASWLRTFLASVGVPMKDVAESFDLLKSSLSDKLKPDEYELTGSIIDLGKQRLLIPEEKTSIPAREMPQTDLAGKYLGFLLKGNRSSALSVILDEVKNGKPVRDIYLEVFQPVQYEIGRLWQTKKISVAQEHFCTAATQLVMSQLYPYFFTGDRKEKKMVMTCVPGELHEMGARMVTDFLEMQGWDTYYLGANMPTNGVVKFISDSRPNFVAISATMTFHISLVEEMIRQIRSETCIPGKMKILVGGYPFKVAPGLWREIGADAFASDATEAAGIAEEFVLT